jgi:hypothetical protein
MIRFDPPGFLQDLDEAQRGAWSDWISQQLDGARARDDANLANDGPRLQFFNPQKPPQTPMPSRRTSPGRRSQRS